MLDTKLNFFEQILYAVTKPKQYYRLTKVSGGRLTGFVFLFLFIISLFSIVPMINSTLGSNGFVRTLQDDLPDFELRGGELYVNGRYESDENNTYVLIDTQIERFDYNDINKKYSQVILISKNNFLNYQSYGKIQEINFNDIQGFHLNNESLTAFIPFIYPLLALIAVIIYLFLLGTYYLSALLYSLLGLFVSSVSHANLTYATIFKTAVYSKITIRILYTLIDLTSLSYTGYLRTMIAILVTCAYVVFGILSHTSNDAYEEAGISIPPNNNNN